MLALWRRNLVMVFKVHPFSNAQPIMCDLANLCSASAQKNLVILAAQLARPTEGITPLVWHGTQIIGGFRRVQRVNDIWSSISDTRSIKFQSSPVLFVRIAMCIGLLMC